jgi:type IV pilus assembly protein PilE
MKRSPTQLTAPGFSLIEVLIALAIVGLLSAIALPNYTAHVVRARRAEARAALSDVVQQQERFYAANRRYAAFSMATPNGFRTYSGESLNGTHYVLSAAACSATGPDACVVISATPAGTAGFAAGSGFADAECGTLTWSTANVRTPANCW